MKTYFSFTQNAIATISSSILLSLALASPVLAADETIGSLTLKDAWVRASVPGQTNGAGYVKIENKGSKPDRLLSASSNASNMVELHTVITENGVAKMQEIKSLEIPAGKTVSMAPGGYHVMFIQLKAPFKDGTNIPVKLKFEHSGEVSLDFAVKPAVHNPNASHGHAQH